jgi:hypothetical protein
MSGKTLRSRIAIFAVLALLAVSGAEAGAQGGSASHAAAPAVTWSFLERLWSLLTGTLTKAGCTIDPSGTKCPASPSGDNGCSLDPDGVCVAAPTADNGCSLDPSGHCSK